MENVLIANIGTNPQIITEALYMFSVKEDIEFDRIVLITTEDCYLNTYENVKKGFDLLNNNTNIKLPKFNKDNIIAGNDEISCKDSNLSNLIFEVTKTETEKENRVTALISGGRKTMSIDLAFAMMLYAKNSDKMYHIVAQQDYQQSKQLFPKNKDDEDKIFLFEKKFLRLNNLVNTHNINSYTYRELIELAQNEIDSSINLGNLIIDKTDLSITIENKKITLQPLQFAVYLFFAKENKFVKGGKQFTKTSSQKIWRIYRQISNSVGQRERVAKYSFNNEILDFDIIQKIISTLKNKINKATNYSPLTEYYIIKSKGNYAGKTYGIALPKTKIKII